MGVSLRGCFFTPSVSLLHTPSGANAPAPPRGRLMEVPQSFPLPQKAVPLGKAEPSQSASVGRVQLPRKGELLRLRQSFRQNRKVSGCAKKTPSQALPRQLPQGGSQAVWLVAKVLGAMRNFPAVLLALPLRKDFPRSGGRCRAAMTERVFPRSHFFYQSVTFRFGRFVVYYGQHGSPWQH